MGSVAASVILPGFLVSPVDLFSTKLSVFT